MKKNSFLWAALSMTAALVMTACTNDDNIVETPAAPQDEVKTIPYTVTVGQGGDAATTRATVADDPSDATNYHKTLYFASGDKLYISSDSRTDLKGVLTLKSSDEGKSSGATFEGSIEYTGDAPAADLTIKATLVGSSNVGVQITDGKVTGMTYPINAYCADVATAVQKYSNLTGTSTYSAKSFTLSQNTAFLNFEITFADGTTAGTELSAVVKNGENTLCTANVTTVADGGVKAKFVLPVAGTTALSGATVKMGDKAALTINDATLTGKVYNVKRTYAKPAATGHALSASAVGEIVGSDGKAYAASDKNNLPSGVTAAAMVAYVGTASDCTHGLAIALADESGKKVYGAAVTACSGKAAVTGGTWRLPSIKDWQYMFIGCGASGSYSDNPGTKSYSYSGLASKLTTAQGDALQADFYWSSTEYDPDGGGAWSVRFDSNPALFCEDDENESNRVRACLAF